MPLELTSIFKFMNASAPAPPLTPRRRNRPTDPPVIYAIAIINLTVNLKISPSHYVLRMGKSAEMPQKNIKIRADNVGRART